MSWRIGKAADHEVRVAAQDVLHHYLQLRLRHDLLRKQVEALQEVLVLFTVA